MSTPLTTEDLDRIDQNLGLRNRFKTLRIRYGRHLEQVIHTAIQAHRTAGRPHDEDR